MRRVQQSLLTGGCFAILLVASTGGVVAQPNVDQRKLTPPGTEQKKPAPPADDKKAGPGQGGERHKSVQAGGEIEVDSRASPIKYSSDGVRGALSLTEIATTPKTYVLKYKAPEKVAATFTDTLKYEVDGKEQAVLVTVTPEATPPSLTNEQLYALSFRALFVLFVIALLVESGLNVIFSWRPFIRTFDGRGVKTLVSLIFAYAFVSAFDLDIVTSLVNLYSSKSFPVEMPGKFITALVIAGGSSAVNNLFLALGLRSVKTLAQAVPKPPRTEAWISVALERKDAVGPVEVFITRGTASAAVAGTITGDMRSGALAKFFLRDYGRFPTVGGYSVPLNVDITVQLAGRDINGKPIKSTAWGPHPLAEGAVVDLERTL